MEEDDEPCKSLNDLYILDLPTMSYSRPFAANFIPPPRHGAGIASDRDEEQPTLLIVGGSLDVHNKVYNTKQCKGHAAHAGYVGQRPKTKRSSKRLSQNAYAELSLRLSCVVSEITLTFLSNPTLISFILLSFHRNIVILLFHFS